MKKANNLRKIWSDLKFLSINKCFYFLARCLAVHPLREKSVLVDSCSVVLHIILAVQGGVLVHCVFCSSPIADNLWWKDQRKSIAPQVAADAVVPPSRGTDTMTSTNHSVHQITLYFSLASSPLPFSR